MVTAAIDITNLANCISPIESEGTRELLTPQATQPRRLQCAVELILLLMVAATALVHPLCLPDEALRELSSQVAWRGLWQQLLPWISCGLSPLIVKESVLMTLVIALLFFFVWIKIRGLVLGMERSALSNGGGWRGWLASPEVWLWLWILYAATSVFWSSAFQSGLQTWVLMAAGSAAFLITRGQSSGRGFSVRFMGITIFCGVVLAWIALMQHLGKIEWLPQSVDPRNRMSSLIGHNTGLSSWLMFPLSYAIYFAMANRRLWVRLLMVAVVALIVLVIIAAESRAIWLLGLLIVLWLPFKISRLMWGRFGFKKLLAGLAIATALVTALMFSPSSNPLARLPVSLGERLSGHVFNLDQLRRETRLRILVVSMSELFPQAPFFGRGLGSFAWDYPKAQGEYFTAHPDSRLGTTTRRTDLAHNDYLQVLTETGLVGLLLVLGAMTALVVQSRRQYRRCTLPHNRALWWALTTPSAAVAVHALVDFPMHVAPIALVALMSAALSTRLDNATEPAISSSDGTSLPPWKLMRRATWISLPVTMVLFAWTPWAWQAFVGRVAVSDIYYNTGTQWLQKFYKSTGQTLEHNITLLERARGAFREAVVTNVFNGEAYEGQATTYVNRAAIALDQLQSHSDELDTTSTIALRSLIERDSQSAITALENQVASGELRYHFTWYLLGRAWRMQWELERTDVPPQHSKAYQEAIAAQRKAIAYNPADATALRELSDLLSQSLNTAKESQAALDRLFEVDPWTARSLLIDPAIKLARIGETTTAQRMLSPIVKRHPDLSIVLAGRAWLAYYEAVWPPAELDNIERKDDYLTWRKQHLAPAVDAVTALPDTKDFKFEKQRLQMLFAAASHDLQLAHTIAKKRIEAEQYDREARSIYYWTDQALYGGSLRLEDSVDYYRTQALLTIYFMDRRQEGLALGELSTRESEDLTLPEARRYVAFCIANDWWDFLDKTLPSILETFPADPVLLEAAEQMQAQ